MKVLLINGSPHKDGCTNVMLEEIKAELERLEVGADIEWLGVKPMQDCIACGSCKKTGCCVYSDDPLNGIAARLDEYDGLIVGSPVYYGGASGRVCSFLDRLFMCGGAKLAGKAAAAVVTCRRGGATAAFERLNMFFGMTNMFVIGSQYWNQIHGNNAEEARRDEEGLQTMRTLAQNMAWFLKSKKAGEQADVCPPVYEETIRTNFIR